MQKKTLKNRKKRLKNAKKCRKNAKNAEKMQKNAEKRFSVPVIYLVFDLQSYKLCRFIEECVGTDKICLSYLFFK